MRSSSGVLVPFTITTCTDERGYYDQPPVSHRSDHRRVKGVWKVRMTWPSFKNGEKRDVGSTYSEAADYYQLYVKEGHRGVRDNPIQGDLIKN